MERSSLLVTDIEILRLHYAETLKAWRERFLAHREEVERIYDRRFVRMWELYLAASEMSFREQDMMVFQIQLTKRQGVVPTTRDYIVRGGRQTAVTLATCRGIAAERRNLLQLERGPDRHRAMAKALQHDQATLIARISDCWERGCGHHDN